MSRSQLIVIVGPTGAGKTDLSVRIAGHYGAPILSTDSRQIYRELPIGTAQPSSDQLHAVEHHFIASHNITQEFNCGAFESSALQLLETLFRRGRRVVAVGGSGLYVRALCEGMDDLPQADGALRRELMRQLETEGGGGAGRTVEEARSGLLRGGRLAESRTCAACRRGLSANRQTLFVAAYRTAQATPVRHREDRRDASARGAVRPHRPAGRRHVGGRVGGGGAADVAPTAASMHCKR